MQTLLVFILTRRDLFLNVKPVQLHVLYERFNFVTLLWFKVFYPQQVGHYVNQSCMALGETGLQINVYSRSSQCYSRYLRLPQVHILSIPFIKNKTECISTTNILQNYKVELLLRITCNIFNICWDTFT